MDKIFYALVATFVLLAGCATESDDSSMNHPNTDSADLLLARPRFERPAVRPLGRVLLRWDAVEGADGYELQSSEKKDFSTVSGSWTVSTANIELPMDSDTIVWFRVRTFDQNSVSRWSSSLRVEEKEL